MLKHSLVIITNQLFLLDYHDLVWTCSKWWKISQKVYWYHDYHL